MLVWWWCCWTRTSRSRFRRIFRSRALLAFCLLLVWFWVLCSWLILMFLGVVWWCMIMMLWLVCVWVLLLWCCDVVLFDLIVVFFLMFCVLCVWLVFVCVIWMLLDVYKDMCVCLYCVFECVWGCVCCGVVNLWWIFVDLLGWFVFDDVMWCVCVVIWCCFLVVCVVWWCLCKMCGIVVIRCGECVCVRDDDDGWGYLIEWNDVWWCVEWWECEREVCGLMMRVVCVVNVNVGVRVCVCGEGIGEYLMEI